MRQLNLTLNERVELGKNKVKKLRKKGFIPGMEKEKIYLFMGSLLKYSKFLKNLKGRVF